MSAEAKLEKALHDAQVTLRNHRAKVVQSHPFFGALLLKQKLVASRDVETMATNGKELFYNPEYVNDQSQDYLTFDVAHEALHPALGHHVRRGQRRFDWWNEACDYVINPILRDAGFHVPDDALIRLDLEGQNAEGAYKILEGERKQPPGDGDGDDDQQPDDDQDDDQGQPPPQPRPSEKPQEEGDDDEAQDDQGGQDDQDGGSGEGQDGDSGDQGQQPQTPSFGGAGAVLDAPVANEAERVQEEQDWKVALTQAANLAKASKEAGKLPADLVRAIEEISEPRASWREILRRFMDQFAQEDYSWQKPNRRFLAQDLYLPSMHSEKMPPFLFVVDASGSMPEESLSQAFGEVQAIVSELQPEFLDVWSHDTRVHQLHRLEPDEPLDEVRAKIRGGGGTAFAPVCQAIADAEEDYSCVVWFTDMEAWDWDSCEAPECPVVFIDWTGDYEDDEPPFGEEVVALDDDWS